MAIKMSPAPKVLTYEEYLAEGAINRRYDIVDGVRIFVPSPGLDHQEIAMNIVEDMRDYQRATHYGRTIIAPFDVLIQKRPLRVRQPDILLISNERFAQAGGHSLKTPLSVAPEVVVEILSDSERQRDIEAKIADYGTIGVKECWLVRPDARTVEVLKLSADGPEPVALYHETDTLQSITFPDMRLSVADFFAV